MDRYGEVIQQFLREGKAYHCYCTKEELDEMRAAQTARKEKPRYDGRCRHRKEPVPGVSPVVRFRNPDAGPGRGRRRHPRARSRSTAASSTT